MDGQKEDKRKGEMEKRQKMKKETNLVQRKEHLCLYN